jgi:hypothetical protein
MVPKDNFPRGKVFHSPTHWFLSTFSLCFWFF